VAFLSVLQLFSCACFYGTYHYDGVPDLQRQDGPHQDAFHECYGWYLRAWFSIPVFLHSSFPTPRRVPRFVDSGQREVEGVRRPPVEVLLIPSHLRIYLFFFPYQFVSGWLDDTVSPTIADLLRHALYERFRDMSTRSMRGLRLMQTFVCIV
jgi:hypothetical protein